jgi:PAS domain S-box-containing protein
MARREGWAALFWSAFNDSRNAMVLLDEQRRHVEVNGAYVKLAGYARDEVIGRPVWEYVADGPRLTDRQWERAIARGELSGEAGLVCADGTITTVQYAGHTEVITGGRLVLFVVLSTSRWGRHSRRDPQTGTGDALSAREREIVRLVAAGETGPEIAEHLHISHATCAPTCATRWPRSAPGRGPISWPRRWATATQRPDAAPEESHNCGMDPRGAGAEDGPPGLPGSAP